MLLLTSGTSSTNAVGGAVSSQAAPAPPPAVTSSRKGMFTDDLHKLVDNWARDAMSLSGRRGSKGHVSYEVSAPLVLPPACPSVAEHGDPAVTTSRGS